MQEWRMWRLGPLLIFLVLVSTRIPGVVEHGRFWAEEGKVYFHNAWTMPWREALLRPELGYLSLIANVAALAARWFVPLREAPHVTTLIALAVQTLPLLILCSASDPWLRRPFILFAAALLLALPAGCNEVWLNTVNSQFHVAVAVALCLALEIPSTQTGKNVRATLLFLAPLCSPITSSLLPLFVGRAILTRDLQRIIYAACLLAGCVIQFVFFYYPLPGRDSPLGPSTLVGIVFAKDLALPFLGSDVGEVVANNTRALLAHGVRPIEAGLTCLLVAILLAGGMVLRRRAEPVWLLLAAGSIGLISYYAALGPHTGLIDVTASNRYAFAPNLLVALALLSLIANSLDRISLGAWAVVIWLLAIGAQDYVEPHMPLLMSGPQWTDGLRSWRSNPAVPIPIWPFGWDVRL